MCEATILTALSMGISGASAVYSASSQQRNASRTANMTVWQALQESQAGYDEARETSEVLVEQTNREAGYTVDQATRSSKTYDLAIELARQNAEHVLAASNREESRVREETSAALAKQSSYFATNNMDPTYGSALALQAFGAAQGESDALIVRASGLQEASEQEWSAYSIASERDESVKTAQQSVESSYRSASEQIESTYRNAGKSGQSTNTAARVSASNTTKSGQYGAATTLLSTVANWAEKAASGKYSWSTSSSSKGK